MRPLPSLLLVEDTDDFCAARVCHNPLEDASHIRIKQPSPLPLQINPTAVPGHQVRPLARKAGVAWLQFLAGAVPALASHGCTLPLTQLVDAGGGGVGCDSRLAALDAVGLQGPEGLRLEGGDPLVALHAESQGRGLARAVGDHACVQIAVLALRQVHTRPCLPQHTPQRAHCKGA